MHSIEDVGADSAVIPPYTRQLDAEAIPEFKLPEHGTLPETAYRYIHDDMLLDGNARLNLATFVTTWMEPEAERLMTEAFDKNMIDKDEYPKTAEIEKRCVNIVAHLFNTPSGSGAVGVSTIGSSEAVMLAGLAMKWKWRRRRQAAGASIDKPNLVLGSNVQVVWEKFCRYWDVEPRYVPMEDGRYVITPDEVAARVDENTIGVVAILGTTYTGEFEPIQAVHDRVVELNSENGWDMAVHVDAASGGFVAPFTQPDLVWDFRLPQVKSINVSGHKYGLTYPGIGFVIWRSQDDLPEDLIFHVDYLGGDMPTFTLNFSRPGNQIVGQYYNFLRLGRDGYTRIMQTLTDGAKELADLIVANGPFEIVNETIEMPVFAFRLTGDEPFTAYDVSDRLRTKGWQVPAYKMPDNASDVVVLRVVVREGFTRDMARDLSWDLESAVDYLRASPPGVTAKPGFSHT